MSCFFISQHPVHNQTIWFFRPQERYLPQQTCPWAIFGYSCFSMFHIPTAVSTGLNLVEGTLKWCHMVPTAPDTPQCYPFFTMDPLLPQIHRYMRLGVNLISSFAQTGILARQFHITGCPHSACSTSVRFTARETYGFYGHYHLHVWATRLSYS